MSADQSITLDEATTDQLIRELGSRCSIMLAGYVVPEDAGAQEIRVAMHGNRAELLGMVPFIQHIVREKVLLGRGGKGKRKKR